VDVLVLAPTFKTQDKQAPKVTGYGLGEVPKSVLAQT
jgi:hypothetical protein